MSRVVNDLVTVVGPLAGGAVLTCFGVRYVYLLDIVSSIVAALIILLIKGDQKPSSFERDHLNKLQIRTTLCKNKDVFSASLLVNFIGGAVAILTLEYIYMIINADAMQYALLMSAMACGALLGSGLGGAPFTQNRLKQISYFCTLALGCLLMSVMFVPGFASLLGIIFISGTLSSLLMLYYSVELFMRCDQNDIRVQYAIFQNLINTSTAASKPFG